MRYKFTEKDYGLLSAAAAIHKNIVLFKGNHIKQMSPSGDVFMISKSSQEIPVTHGISDLNIFIKSAKESGYEKCEFEYLNDFGYGVNFMTTDIFDDIDEEWDLGFDDDDNDEFFIDEDDLILFLNEYYLVYDDKLPGAEYR
jgi:hypothetical protein